MSCGSLNAGKSMLKIREERLEAFREQRRWTFEDAAAGRRTVAGTEAAKARIWMQNANPLALRYGFRVEAEILRVLDPLYALERNGGSSPEAAKGALDDAKLSTAIKLRLLEDKAGQT